MCKSLEESTFKNSIFKFKFIEQQRARNHLATGC